MKCRTVQLAGPSRQPAEDRATTKALAEITAAVAQSRRAVMAVGAGISTSAGIPDFRSKDNGLYKSKRVSSSSSPALRGPGLFSASVYASESTRTQHWSFLANLHASTTSLLAQSKSRPITPTHGLMQTLHKRRQLKRVYSQNIDGFEASAGLKTVEIEGIRCTPVVLSDGQCSSPAKGKGEARQWEGEYVQLHGSLGKVRCSACEWVGDWTKEHTEAFAEGMTVDCPACEERAAGRARMSKRAIPSRSYVRPSIVLYDETSAAASSIGSISITDLSSSPDLLIVAGTSLRIPGFKKLVKEFSKAVKSQGGICIFVNREAASSKEWEGVFDYQVLGNADDFCQRVVADWKASRPRDWVTQKTLAFAPSKQVALPGSKTSTPASRPPLRNLPSNVPLPSITATERTSSEAVPSSTKQCQKRRSSISAPSFSPPSKRRVLETTPVLTTVPLPEVESPPSARHAIRLTSPTKSGLRVRLGLGSSSVAGPFSPRK